MSWCPNSRRDEEDDIDPDDLEDEEKLVEQEEEPVTKRVRLSPHYHRYEGMGGATDSLYID